VDESKQRAIQAEMFTDPDLHAFFTRLFSDPNPLHQRAALRYLFNILPLVGGEALRAFVEKIMASLPPPELLEDIDFRPMYFSEIAGIRAIADLIVGRAGSTEKLARDVASMIPYALEKFEIATFFLLTAFCIAGSFHFTSPIKSPSSVTFCFTTGSTAGHVSLSSLVSGSVPTMRSSVFGLPSTRTRRATARETRPCDRASCKRRSPPPRSSRRGRTT
jgi:hypothetical protein